MYGIENLGAFLIAGILLNLTPGADTIFILTRSIGNGKKAGILSAIGINVGSLIHTILVSFGLSIILKESEAAFNIVKYLGAFYLIYLGLNTIIKKRSNFKILDRFQSLSPNKIFISGVLSNLLNPKVALFFLAYLPQFVSFTHVNSHTPFLILGLIFTSTGTIWSLFIAIIAAKFSEFIRNNQKINLWLNKSTGLVFILLGLNIALSKRNI